jgi:hypothetical protein
MTEVLQATQVAVFPIISRRFQFAKPSPIHETKENKKAHTRIEFSQCGYVNDTAHRPVCRVW